MLGIGDRLSARPQPSVLSVRRNALVTATVWAIGCLIMMGEIDRLISSSLGVVEGGTPSVSRSLNSLLGVGAFWQTDSWGVWSSGLEPGSVALWIGLSAGIDTAFVFIYIWLATQLLPKDPPPTFRAFVRGVISALVTVLHIVSRVIRILWNAARHPNKSTLTPTATPAPGSVVKFLISALLVVELLEDMLLGFFAGLFVAFSRTVPDWLAVILATVTSLKWLLVALLIVSVLVTSSTRERLWRNIKPISSGLWLHRLSVIVVATFGILALVPSANIFDQLPDTQRQWVDAGGIWSAWWALLSLVVVALGLFLLGRRRSERAYSRWGRDAAAAPDVGGRKWSVAALAIAVLASLLSVAAHSWRPVVIGAVPLIVLFVSWVIKSSSPAPDFSPEEMNERRAQFAWYIGDALPVLLLSFGGLGLLRSFTAAILVEVSPYGVDLAGHHNVVRIGREAFFFTVSILAIVAATVWTSRLIRNFDAALERRRSDYTRRFPFGSTRGVTRPKTTFLDGIQKLFDPLTQVPARDRFLICTDRCLLVLSGGGLLAIALWPIRFTVWAGVVATTVTALGLWALLLGTITVALQRYAPLPVFAKLRLRATPVLSLFVLVPLITSQLGGDPLLHQIRVQEPPAALSPGSTPILLEAIVKKWSETAPECTVTSTTSAVRVRPLLLIASEGGGIRAAVWTGGVLDALSYGNICTKRAALSSGVSGGSLGLVLSHVHSALNLDSQDARKATSGTIDADDPFFKLANPHPLAAAAAGFLVGDVISAVLGTRIYSEASDGWHWHDRAALMETAWESAADELKQTTDYATKGPAGAIVLNSTDAASGCKVLVGQVQTGSSPDDAPSRVAGKTIGSSDCSGAGGYPAGSVDFSQIIAPRCATSLAWSTTAMLSARFPFITPDGRIPSVSGNGACAGDKASPNAQLIDGGYAEGSGLGTLSDLSPSIAAQILQLNQAASVNNDTAGKPLEPYVVPILLYIKNSLGNEVSSPANKLASELFVPLVGQAAESHQVTASAWIQRIAQDLRDSCPPTTGNSDCHAAQDAVAGRIPNLVVVAAPDTVPAITAPLGWTLSSLSLDRLNTALHEQQMPNGPCCPGASGANGRLYDLLNAFSDCAKPCPANH